MTTMAKRKVWLRNLDGKEKCQWSGKHERFIIMNSAGNTMFLTANAVIKRHPFRGLYLEDDTPGNMAAALHDILFTSTSYERLYGRPPV